MNEGNSGGETWNDGTLTVSDSTIGNDYPNKSGGGIYNTGTLTLQQARAAPRFPHRGIAVSHSGRGYGEVGADGGVFTYGDAPFSGSIDKAIGNHALNGPIVKIEHLGSVTPPARGTRRRGGRSGATGSGPHTEAMRSGGAASPCGATPRGP